MFVDVQLDAAWQQPSTPAHAWQRQRFQARCPILSGEGWGERTSIITLSHMYQIDFEYFNCLAVPFCKQSDGCDSYTSYAFRSVL